MNLGINARHSMPDGGSIHIKTQKLELDKDYCVSSPFEIKPGNYVKIEFRDTGCGIHPDNLSKIFDPFYTTSERGKGTGLGLSSVYGTIQEHHGVITVLSEVGKGTTFLLYLPSSDNPVPVKGKKDKNLSGNLLQSPGSGGS